MSFSLQAKKAITNIKSEQSKVVRGTLLGIFSRTIRRTPVVSGRLRNNWHTSIGQVDNGTRGENKTGTDSLSSASDGMKSFKIGDVVYFSNNLPYAERIENGGFAKAPAGMLKVSISEVTL